MENLLGRLIIDYKTFTIKRYDILYSYDYWTIRNGMGGIFKEVINKQGAYCAIDKTYNNEK